MSEVDEKKEGEDCQRSLDSPGRSLEVESNMNCSYPAEFLSTSWGSYLFSLPPTAGRSGRRMTIDSAHVGRSENEAYEMSVSPTTHGLPSRSNHLCTVAMNARGGQNQLHPLLHSLLSALSTTQKQLASCGIDSVPLGEACRLLDSNNQVPIQQEQTNHHSPTTSTPLCSESTVRLLEHVLEALVLQAKRIQEHTNVLKRTAVQLRRNQQQFASGKQELQQAMEIALSHIMAEKHDLEERKALLQESRTIRREESNQKLLPGKSLIAGLKESKHKMALSQIQKDQNKLEKTLLQLQRELRQLEHAHKATQLELAAEQYATEKLQRKIAANVQTVPDSSSKSLHHTQKVYRLWQRCNEGNQHLNRVKQEVELCRLRLRKTDSQLKCNPRGQLDISQGAIHRKFGGGLQNGTTPSFPPIHSTDKALQPQLGIPQASSHSSVSAPHHIHLPKIPKVHHHQRESCDVSRSELMSLAKFRSPAVAEEVMQWLGKRGHLHEDTI